MRKKILIAEQSDTTRGVAENVLRQHGYEVISISNGDKALEVLEHSRPNLIMVDSKLTVKGNRNLIERIQDSHLTSSIPFLLICDELEDTGAFPDEVKLTRPLDPKELILKVSVLGGSAHAKPAGDALNPMDESLLEDDSLDAALGLDQLDVTDSEVLGNSLPSKKKGAVGIEKMIGMEQDNDRDAEDDSQGNKIESTRFEEDESEVRSHDKKSSKNLPKSENLEILSEGDQFGLGNDALFERDSEAGHHDYEWFIKEMKKDNTPGAKPIQQKPASNETKPSKTSTHSETPAPPNKKSDSGKLKGESGGVDKFIEDFKKEVEKFTDSPHSAPAKPAKPASAPKTQTPANPKPNGGLENVTIDQVEVFTRQFVHILAEKVAEKIATKIDPQKLLSLIKNEIVSKNQKQ